MAEKQLTPQQKKFADEYVKTSNAYQAALSAGYSDAYAKGRSYELLENKGIKKYIDERLAKRQEKYDIDADYLIKHADEILREARGVKTWRDRKVGLDAIEQLARLTGAYAEFKQRVKESNSQPNEIVKINIFGDDRKET